MTAVAENKKPTPKQLIAPVLALICLGIMFPLNWTLTACPDHSPPFQPGGFSSHRRRSGNLLGGARTVQEDPHQLLPF